MWGGKKTGWVTYDEPVQRQLRELWRNGGGSVEVTINTHVYDILLTAEDDMWQDRQDTDQPPRQVRFLEHNLS